MPTPKVSVCIANYNYGRFLGECIRSVLDQNFDDLEVIVVDNCSTDDSAGVVARIGDSRVRFFQNRFNLGMIGNYSRSMELAQGDYLTFLDSDNAISPGWLEEAVALLDANPDIGFVYPARMDIDEAGRPTGDRYGWPESHVWDAKEELRHLVVTRISVPFSAAVVRRSLADAAGPLDTEASYPFDIDFWARVCLTTPKTAYVNKPMLRYRSHDGRSSSYTSFQYEQNLYGMSNYKVVKLIGSKMPPGALPEWPQIEAEALRRVATDVMYQAIQNLSRGRYGNARDNLFLVLAFQRGVLLRPVWYGLFFASLLGPLGSRWLGKTALGLTRALRGGYRGRTRLRWLLDRV